MGEDWSEVLETEQFITAFVDRRRGKGSQWAGEKPLKKQRYVCPHYPITPLSHYPVTPLPRYSVTHHPVVM